MLCSTKNIVRWIILSISLFCLQISVTKANQNKVDAKQFNEVAEQVKQLKKNDLVLSLKKLKAFENSLSLLSIKQNLLYFNLLTDIHIEQNKYTTAKKTAKQGLIIAKRLTSPSILMSELLYLKGFAHESLGDLSQAAIEYKKGLEVAESLHNKVQVASGLINLGAIAYLKDDYKRSLVLLNDAYNIAGQTEDEELKGTVNNELGIVYSYVGQDEQSMEYNKQSYLHFKKAGLLLAAHTSLQNIALKHILNKDYQQAISVYKTIISESNKDSPSDSMFSVYSGLAWAYLKKEDSNADAAYEYLLRAKQYLQSTEKVDYHLDYYYAEAKILNKLERFDEALVSLAQRDKYIINHQDISLIKKKNNVNAFGLKANILYEQKKYKQAYQTKTRQITLTDKLYENEDNRSIAQVRLRLESEQADKQNKVLNNKNILYEVKLKKAKQANEEQRFYLIISALVALAFAWVLVKLLQSQHKLKIASSIDPLTGVANRRSLMKKTRDAFKSSKTSPGNFSILMIDVDDFKGINDSLGHSVGDKVLAKIAELGAGMMRKSDIFGRFGGEEFMVCLPKSNLKSAMEIGERVRSCISDYSWQFKELKTVKVSVGVATLADDTDLIELIKRADEQLYHAKASGRNKVCGQ